MEFYCSNSLPTSCIVAQHMNNRILSETLRILAISMNPPGVTTDDMEWWRWQRENPVNTPRWRR